MPFTYPTAHPGAGRGHFVFRTARGACRRPPIRRAVTAVRPTVTPRLTDGGMRTTARRERSTAHACAVPVSEEQLWELTAQFVAAGLVAGEQVVYFDDGTVDAVLERLVDDRVPVRRPLADGQLTVVDTEKTRQSRRGAVGGAARMLATHIDGAVH